MISYLLRRLLRLMYVQAAIEKEAELMLEGDFDRLEKMKKPENVFELWIERGKKLPFYVRRWSWHHTTRFLIERVVFKEDYYIKTGKPYGFAYGKFFQHNRLSDITQPLSCAGCYQWEEVKPLQEHKKDK